MLELGRMVAKLFHHQSTRVRVGLAFEGYHPSFQPTLVHSPLVGKMLSVFINQNKPIKKYLASVGGSFTTPVGNTFTPIDLSTLGLKLEQLMFCKSITAVSSVINSDTLVSPVPYTMSHIWTHMDTNATINNQLSFTSLNCQPTIVLMDQRTNAKTPAHQTVYWT
ncbi:hypothetical protein BDEG_27215 [Batrachochytrium dendrobatidis JEL423]|uniref:Uncharacterized protein n=1 Tax=Batrachochytrium dendrobatidis (strain JEL423) TaxID=403673 RepID=A0A177WVJ0_BATDL|nr:hypothetical protein BDEG_27215 [Batrachochytrium dendrobatidis JEL423]